MKKCPKCGTILDDSKKKCYRCGTSLNDEFVNSQGTFNTPSDDSNTSFNSVFENSDFLFNNSNNNSSFEVPEDAFFDAGMDKLNSMEYDERSGLKKGFDTVFKSGDSFKSKDDELKKAAEAEEKRKQKEEQERLKREEKEKQEKEKQLKKERDRERHAHEKAEREREKAERNAALKLEREQKAKEKAEREQALRNEKLEKERIVKEQKAKEAEELRLKKEQEKQLLIAQNEEKRRIELEAAQKRNAELEQKKQEQMEAQKIKQQEKQRAKELEVQAKQEAKAKELQFRENERIRKQEAQAAKMKAERDSAFNKQFQDKKKVNESKPSINWGDGLIDSGVDNYKDKVNKANSKKSMNGILNFLSILLFVGMLIFGYFKFVRPSMDSSNEIGRLSYNVNKDFKLSNKADDNKFYSYGESCGLRISYGMVSESNSFVDNYFNDIKTQYESDMNSFTEKSSIKINGNLWSELSIIYLEDTKDLSMKENVVKYRYVSIVYEGHYYHTVFVNPNNDKRCYEMYEEFIQSMEFDKKR